MCGLKLWGDSSLWLPDSSSPFCVHTFCARTCFDTFYSIKLVNKIIPKPTKIFCNIWEKRGNCLIFLIVQAVHSQSGSVHSAPPSFCHTDPFIIRKSCPVDSTSASGPDGVAAALRSTLCAIFLTDGVVLYSNVQFNLRPKSIFMVYSHANPSDLLLCRVPASWGRCQSLGIILALWWKSLNNAVQLKKP